MARIRVMSFNIRGSSFAQDGVNAWANRAALNVATIQRYAPDLIGFQEVHSGNLATYEEHLRGYQWIRGPQVDTDESDRGNPIFWRSGQFREVSSGGFWLSETPDCRSIGWDAALVRGATWVRLVWDVYGLELLHLNTHLDHLGEEARAEASRLILRQVKALAEPGVPVMLTGDFNCSAPLAGESTLPSGQPEPYRVLSESEFADTYLVASERDSGPPNTFHDFMGDAFVPWDPELTVRIDWILTLDRQRRFETESSIILRDHLSPLYPSDHYPVLADLALRGGS
jgi:endonuclease/exonuclease/phosphatase family metal-dependent hydrolase